MICPFCLDFIPNTCTVCPSCGERVSAFSEADLHCSHDGAPVRPGFTPLSPTTPSRRKRSTPMLTIVLTLLVLVGRLGIALIFLSAPSLALPTSHLLFLLSLILTMPRLLLVPRPSRIPRMHR